MKCASSRRANKENKSDQTQAQKAGLIQSKAFAIASESRNIDVSQGPKLHTNSKVIHSSV